MDALVVLAAESSVGRAVAEAALMTRLPVIAVSTCYRTLTRLRLNHPEANLTILLGSIVDERSLAWLAADLRRLNRKLSGVIAPICVQSQPYRGKDGGTSEPLHGMDLTIRQHASAAKLLAPLLADGRGARSYLVIREHIERVDSASPGGLASERVAPQSLARKLRKEVSSTAATVRFRSTKVPAMTGDTPTQRAHWRAAVGSRAISLLRGAVSR